MKKTVEMYLRGKFGNIHFKPATFSGTNQIYLLEGTTPLRVAKIAGLSSGDIFNEYECSRFIEDSGLAPKSESIDDIDGSTVLIMEGRPGKNLLEIILELSSTDWRESLPFYRRLGSWLTTIHKHRYCADYNIRSSELERIKDILWSIAFVPEEVARASYEAICRIDENQAEWVLTHGDYGAHNILFSETGEVSIIDWEFGEWNHPLSDIANVHFWTHLHFPENAHERCQSFVERYRSQLPLAFSGELVRSYSIYRIWFILLRVEELPGQVKAEWVRRLRWTLQHDFIG